MRIKEQNERMDINKQNQNDLFVSRNHHNVFSNMRPRGYRVSSSSKCQIKNKFQLGQEKLRLPTMNIRKLQL